MSTEYYFICKECNDKCHSDHSAFYDLKPMQEVYDCRKAIAECYHLADCAQVNGASQCFYLSTLGYFFEKHEGHFISIVDEYGRFHKLDYSKDVPVSPDLVHLRQLKSGNGLNSDIQPCDGKPAYKTSIVKRKSISSIAQLAELNEVPSLAEAQEFNYRKSVPAVIHIYED